MFVVLFAKKCNKQQTDNEEVIRMVTRSVSRQQRRLTMWVFSTYQRVLVRRQLIPSSGINASPPQVFFKPCNCVRVLLFVRSCFLLCTFSIFCSKRLKCSTKPSLKQCMTHRVCVCIRLVYTLKWKLPQHCTSPGNFISKSLLAIVLFQIMRY